MGKYYEIYKLVNDAVRKTILDDPSIYVTKVTLPRATSRCEREELKFTLSVDGYDVYFPSVKEMVVDWSKDKEPDKRRKKTRR